MSGDGEGRHPGEDALHRFAERGELAPDTGAVADHLRSCERCRREVESVRDLRRRAAALPREIEPAVDLWPGVEERIRDGGVPAGPERAVGRLGDLRLRAGAPWLAAAAALLVAATAGVTAWLADGGTGPEPGRVAATAPAARGPESTGGRDAGRTTEAVARPAGLAGVEASYRPTVERLTALLEARQERLPPEARAALERNLRIVDAAIAEAESAVLGGPASSERIRALDRSYRRKVETLQRSVRLTAQL